MNNPTIWALISKPKTFTLSNLCYFYIPELKDLLSNFKELNNTQVSFWLILWVQCNWGPLTSWSHLPAVSCPACWLRHSSLTSVGLHLHVAGSCLSAVGCREIFTFVVVYCVWLCLPMCVDVVVMSVCLNRVGCGMLDVSWNLKMEFKNVYYRQGISVNFPKFPGNSLYFFGFLHSIYVGNCSISVWHLLTF